MKNLKSFLSALGVKPSGMGLVLSLFAAASSYGVTNGVPTKEYRFVGGIQSIIAGSLADTSCTGTIYETGDVSTAIHCIQLSEKPLVYQALIQNWNASIQKSVMFQPSENQIRLQSRSAVTLRKPSEVAFSVEIPVGNGKFSTVTFPVTRISPHPDWAVRMLPMPGGGFNTEYDWDVAAMRLAPKSFSTKEGKVWALKDVLKITGSAKLPSRIVAPGEEITFVGYGIRKQLSVDQQKDLELKDRETHKKVAAILGAGVKRVGTNRIRFNMGDPNSKFQIWPAAANTYVPLQMFVTYGTQGDLASDNGRDSCVSHGDSGGPALVRDGSNYQMMGIASFVAHSQRFGEKQFPCFHQNVAAKATWMFLLGFANQK